MLRQLVEERGASLDRLERDMYFARIARELTIDRTETSFGGEGKMTQKEYKEAMELADKLASKLR